MAHTEVIIDESRKCYFCDQEGIDKDAEYDGKTVNGPWADMCRKHFQMYGVGLGLGKGQKLIVRQK